MMLVSEMLEIRGNIFSVQHRSAAYGSVLGYRHVGLCEPGFILVLGLHLAGVSVAVLSIRSRFLIFVIAPARQAALAPAPAHSGRAALEGREGCARFGSTDSSVMAVIPPCEPSEGCWGRLNAHPLLLTVNHSRVRTLLATRSQPPVTWGNLQGMVGLQTQLATW